MVSERHVDQRNRTESPAGNPHTHGQVPLHHGAQVISGANVGMGHMALGQLESTQKKMNLDLCLILKN